MKMDTNYNVIELDIQFTKASSSRIRNGFVRTKPCKHSEQEKQTSKIRLVE